MYNLPEYLENRVAHQLQREAQVEPMKQMPDPHTFVNENVDHNVRTWFEEFGDKNRFVELIDQTRDDIHKSFKTEIEKADNQVNHYQELRSQFHRDHPEEWGSPKHMELNTKYVEAEQRLSNLVYDLDKIDKKIDSFKDEVQKMDFKEMLPEDDRQLLALDPQRERSFEMKPQQEQTLEMEIER